MNLKRITTFAVATIGALFLVTGVALAATLTGGTNQPGKSITLKTAADGSVRTAKVTWKTKCDNGQKPTGFSTFRGIKRSTPAGFSTSSGKFVKKKGKYKYIFRSKIEGEAKGLGFAGTFNSKVKVEKRGDTITKCNTGKVRWSAK